MSVFVRTKIPWIILLFCGLLMISVYYLDVPDSVANIANEVTNLAVAVAAFAVGVGTISLVRRNYQVINRRREGWMYDAWALVVMTVFIVVGVAFGTKSDAYTWIFSNIFTQINITVASLLAFFVVYSFYRAFVARSWESAVMLLASAFTLIGRAPIGEAIWPGFVTISNWIGSKAAVGGISGFYIAGAIGSVAIALRILWGKEKAALG